MKRFRMTIRAVIAMGLVCIGIVTDCAVACGTETVSTDRKDPTSKPKNIVFFLVDDLGWADLGCYGSRFHETPNIDQLAKTGVRFQQAYAACPVCSPTRASILTGRHPVRVDITDWIPGMDSTRLKNVRFKQVEDRDNLALDETTIAESLKSRAGYTTFFAGKWHLGDKGHWPTDQGFDFNVGGNSKGSPPGGYYSPWKNPTLKAKGKGEYLTERLTDESVHFLKEHKKKNSKTPFLLYLSYYNVHTPITPYRKKMDGFVNKKTGMFKGETTWIKERNGQTRTRQDNAAYASMISSVDESVGRILVTLKELSLTNDTAIFVFSDNGGLSTLRNRPGPTSNLPLRAGKGWLYEGGIREPTIVSVPGLTQQEIGEPGSICQSPVVSMDFFPTMLELAGLELDPKLHPDGKSLMPLLRNPDLSRSRDLFWHYPHYHGSTWEPGAAVRSGDWKLIEFYEESRVELYNLKDDPGESKDLSEIRPEILKKLRSKLGMWQKQLNAKMPQKRN